MKFWLTVSGLAMAAAVCAAEDEREVNFEAQRRLVAGRAVTEMVQAVARDGYAKKYFSDLKPERLTSMDFYQWSDWKGWRWVWSLNRDVRWVPNNDKFSPAEFLSKVMSDEGILLQVFVYREEGGIKVSRSNSFEAGDYTIGYWLKTKTDDEKLKQALNQAGMAGRDMIEREMAMVDAKELNGRANEALGWFLQQLKPLMVKYPVLQGNAGWTQNDRNTADATVGQWITFEKNTGWIQNLPGADGTLPQQAQRPVVEKDGVQFYFYISELPPKLEGTRFATVKFGAKQAGAFYYFKTNPADSELEKAIGDLFVRTVRRIDANAVIQQP